MGKAFWSYDGESLAFHDTVSEAKVAAGRALEHGGDGWSEYVDQVAWGAVYGRAVEFNKTTLEEAKERDPDLHEHMVSEGWAYHSEYKLQELVDVATGPPPGWSPRDDGWVQLSQVHLASADVDQVIRRALPDLVESLQESGAPSLGEGLKALHAAHRGGVAAYARLMDRYKRLAAVAQVVVDGGSAADADARAELQDLIRFAGRK